MSMFRVTPSQLKSQATQLRTDNANFQKLIQSLSEKEQLLSSQWEGEANTAFHNAFLNDFQQFQNFHSGIEKFIERPSSRIQIQREPERLDDGSSAETQL